MGIKESRKRSDSKPERQKARTARARLWEQSHAEACRARMAKLRKQHGRNDGIYAQMIDIQRCPLTIKSENIILASDWHIPFYDKKLLQRLLEVQSKHEVTDIAIPGDLWDCDNYSRFTHMTSTGTFKEEVCEVREVMEILSEVFKNIYICRGNHEKRWIDLNSGRMDMFDMFSLLEIREPKHVITMDDHMYLLQSKEKWLLCHPKNFRQVCLSVAKDLAAKFLCHVGVAHGHQFAQGWDRSGKFRLFDMGGLFDRNAIDYLRETTCHPEVRSGFYHLENNILHPYDGNL